MGRFTKAVDKAIADHNRAFLNDPAAIQEAQEMGDRWREQLENEQRECRTCGEPEFGTFGWFDTDDEGTICQRCGSNPLKPVRRRLIPRDETGKVVL